MPAKGAKTWLAGTQTSEIAAKPGHRDDIASDPSGVCTLAYRIDATADFIARHRRQRRQCPGKDPGGPVIFGEINPARRNLIRTSPAFGSGLGASLTWRTSGGPAFVIQICRIR